MALKDFVKEFQAHRLAKRAGDANAETKQVEDIGTPQAGISSNLSQDINKASDPVVGGPKDVTENQGTGLSDELGGPAFIQPGADGIGKTPEVKELIANTEEISKLASATIARLKKVASSVPEMQKRASAGLTKQDVTDWAAANPDTIIPALHKLASAGDALSGELLGFIEYRLNKLAADEEEKKDPEEKGESAEEQAAEAEAAGEMPPEMAAMEAAPAEGAPVEGAPAEAGAEGGSDPDDIAADITMKVMEQAEQTGQDPEEIMNLIPVVAKASAEMVDQLVNEQGMSPEEAVSAVTDAQQSLAVSGAVEGAPEDVQAAAADDMAKTASAFPLREPLCEYLYQAAMFAYKSRG